MICDEPETYSDVIKRGDGIMPKITEIKDMESLIQRMLSVSSDSVVYRKIATYIEQNHMQIIFMTARAVFQSFVCH